jgi:integrase
MYQRGNDMKYVQPIRDKSKIERVKEILKHQSYRDYFMFVMGMNTGLRISDLLQLKVTDVKNRSHITITEKKTGKDKRFPINGNLRTEIDAYVAGLDEEDYLFPSKKTDKPITRIQAYRILNDAAAKVGLDEIGTHTLRKTFGYHFYQKTKDVALLQELFNHSAPSVTMRYIGINQDVIDRAIEDFSL